MRLFVDLLCVPYSIITSSAERTSNQLIAICLSTSWNSRLSYTKTSLGNTKQKTSNTLYSQENQSLSLFTKEFVLFMELNVYKSITGIYRFFRRSFLEILVIEFLKKTFRNMQIYRTISYTSCIQTFILS